MRIVVTGGAGFIGSNLCSRLLETPQVSSVAVLDDLTTGSKDRVPDGVELNLGSILDADLVATVLRGADAVVHLAAIPSVPRSIANPRATHDANTTGTLNVLEAARDQGCGQVIVASSSSVYGSNPQMPKSEFTWTRPMSPYAVSKQATEGYAIAYGYSYQLPTVAFRFFNVFGPGQAADHAYAAVIPRFIDAALAGRPLSINGDGHQSRDFTYVGTVCGVIVEAILRKMGHLDPINLAFGTNTSLLELVAMIESLVGRSLQVDFQSSRVGDVRSSQADPSLLMELFSDITPVPLSDGLARTLRWFTAT